MSQLGGPDNGAFFVPHGQYTAQMMKNLGEDVIDKNYPKDHTHTAPCLSDLIAGAFVLGLRCGTSALGELVLNSTLSLTSSPLGDCLTGFNSTVADTLR